MRKNINYLHVAVRSDFLIRTMQDEVIYRGEVSDHEEKVDLGLSGFFCFLDYFSKIPQVFRFFILNIFAVFCCPTAIAVHLSE